MLPSVNLNINRKVIGFRTIVASKFCTLSLCEKGAGEVPRYQEMVGTGLPEEKQAMLTESPSCIVTVPFRLMVVGVSVCTKGATNYNGIFMQFLVHNKSCTCRGKLLQLVCCILTSLKLMKMVHTTQKTHTNLMSKQCMTS